jgi:nucleoside-diphosphate-sugar epimerase
MGAGGKVLVTGASGFIGRPVLKRLINDDNEVHAVSRSPSSVAPERVVWHRLDLFDSAAVWRLLEDVRPDSLLHAAWYVEHGRFWEAPENLDWVGRTLELLRAFANVGGRRAVMLGTCAEYDWLGADGPLEEGRAAIEPATLYGAAKDAVRRLACAYAERAGVELAWARLFFFFGPREDPRRLVASVIRSLLSGAPAKTTSGRQKRDFMYVDEVARAVVELLRSAVVGPVNVASGTAMATAELVDRIATEIGRPELVQRGALADRAGEPPLLLADVTRLREEVGFIPRMSTAEAIHRTVAWWRTNEDPGPPR